MHKIHFFDKIQRSHLNYSKTSLLKIGKKNVGNKSKITFQWNSDLIGIFDMTLKTSKEQGIKQAPKTIKYNLMKWVRCGWIWLKKQSSILLPQLFKTALVFLLFQSFFCTFKLECEKKNFFSSNNCRVWI